MKREKRDDSTISESGKGGWQGPRLKTLFQYFTLLSKSSLNIDINCKDI